MSPEQHFGASRRPVHLIGNQLRGVMVHAIAQLGQWHGTRRGIKIELALDRSSPRSRVQWRARIRKEWKQGNAESVYAAIAAIEEIAGQVNT